MTEENLTGFHMEALPLENRQSMSAKRAMAIVAIFFLVQVFAVIAFGFVLGLYLSIFRGVDPPGMEEAISSLVMPITILSTVVAGLIAFLMTRRTFTRMDALATIGWRKSRMSGIMAAAFIGLFISLANLLILVPAFPPETHQQWGPVTTSVLAGGWTLILWAIFALALAPPIEEFIFRGVLFSGLSNAMGIRAAGVVVSIVFVLLHATETINYWPAWFALSLVAGATVWFRVKTGSFLPSIALHASYNLVIVFFTFVGSA